MIGIYFDSDNERFHEMTAEHFTIHFNVNTLVSTRLALYFYLLAALIDTSQRVLS